MRDYLYRFVGAVFVFDKLATRDYVGYTRAMSEAKAMNNIKAQYKFDHGLKMNVPIRLEGDIEKLPDAATVYQYRQLSMF